MNTLYEITKKLSRDFGNCLEDTNFCMLTTLEEKIKVCQNVQEVLNRPAPSDNITFTMINETDTLNMQMEGKLKLCKWYEELRLRTKSLLKCYLKAEKTTLVS